jgi:Rieske 2Fe-2S family protein
LRDGVASCSCASRWIRLGPLASQLGPIVERTARYPLAELRTARRITYDAAANWKCIVENFNECYHCGQVHPELCEVVPAFKRVGGGDLDWDRGIPHREGATTFTFTGTTDRAPFPGLSEDERTRHKGELIYPNLMLSMSPDHITMFTLWPKGPGRTVIDLEMDRREVDQLCEALIATSCSTPRRWPGPGSIPRTRWSSGTW